jgi:hypothetical protein
VLHTKGQGGENSFLFHHHRQEVYIEDRGNTQDTKVNLEAWSGLGGEKWTWRRELDLEERCGLGGEKWTERRRGLGSEKHTWMMQERCTLDEDAIGGYDCKKRSRMIRRSSGLDRYGG